jgi:DNA-binding SARP family transcriptional activator
LAITSASLARAALRQELLFADVQFGILGPFEVTDGDRVLDLGALRQRAVLAILAINANTTVSLDRVIDELWGDEAPAAATASIQAYISNLRRVLEPVRVKGTPPQVLVTKAPGYLVRADADDLDHRRFERLVSLGRNLLGGGDPEGALAAIGQGLGLWRGDALADFTFQPFAAVEIVRLNELRAIAVETRFEAMLATGRHAAAVGDIERAIAEFPLREGLRVLLMTALYRSGRQAEALRAYEEARSMLADELGLEPGPELAKVHRAVLEHDPQLLTVTPLSSTPAAIETVPIEVSEFVGRSQTFADLRAQLDRVQKGSTRFSLIVGEPGVGKTRLAEELAHDAAVRGFTVTWGWSHDEAGSPPLWPWVQVLRGLDPCHLTIPPDVRSTLTAIVPELGGSREAVPDGEAARFRLYGAVCSALRAATTDGPLLIVLDDLQWTDVSTLRLLRYVAAECRDVALLVVGVFHEPADFAPGGFGATIADLVRRDNVVRHRLDGLSIDEATELVGRTASVAPDELAAVAQQLHRRTNGNAFFLTELIRLLRSERLLGAGAANDNSGGRADIASAIPQVVGDVVKRRLQRLPDDVRAALTIAAVVGQEFELRVVQAVAGLGDDQALDVIDAAVVSSLVVDIGDDRYRFAHGVARDAIYRELNASRLARMHAAVAVAIESLFPTALAERADQLALHFALAGDSSKEADYTVVAAEVAEARWAYDEAEAHWRRLIELGDRDGVAAPVIRSYVRLVQALRNGGRIDEWLDVFNQALHTAESTDQFAVLIDELFQVGGEGLLTLREYGSVDRELIAKFERLLVQLPEGRGAAAVRAMILLAVALYYDVDSGGKARSYAHAAVEHARELGDDELLGEALTRLVFMADPEPDRTRVQSFVDELERVIDQLRPPISWTAHLRLARVKLSLGDASSLDQRVHDVAQSAESAKWFGEAVFTTWACAGVDLLRGRLADAERVAGQAFAMHQRLGTWGALETYGLNMIYIWREQDKLVEMAPVVEPMLAGAVHPGARRMRAMFARARDDADAVAEILGADPVPRVQDFTWLCDVCVTAELAADAHLPYATELFDMLRPYSDRVATMDGTYFCLGAVSYYLGLLATETTRPDAIAFHARGLALNDQIGGVAWSVRSRYALAMALRDTDPARAHVLLDEGLTIAGRHRLVAMQRVITNAMEQR